MGSLDELRDLHKSSTKSKHLEVKTNGSTFSKVYKNEIYKRGNLVRKQVFGIDDGMSEIDEKYGINSKNLNYSLNKKGRWKMNEDLMGYLRDVKNDENNDTDVRVYETRDRILSSYDNCVSFKRSKGNDLKFKSTYANKKSIDKMLSLEAQRARDPREEIKELKNTKKQKGKKTSKKQNEFDFEEHVIIDLNDHDNDEQYIEYEIQLPPTMEVLKYNTLFEQKRKDKVSSRQTKNILGDELDLKEMKAFFNDSLNELNEFEDEFNENEYVLPVKTKKYSLAELINQFTKPIAERRMNDLNRKSKSKIDEKELRKIIYINRQESKVDNKQQKFENVASNSSQNLNSLNSVALKIQVTSNSLEKNYLKEKFGSRYYEAFNAWPRMISISLNEDIIEEISKNNLIKNYDIKAWLTIKQVRNAEENSDNDYNLILKTNINENKINLKSILDLNETLEFEVIYKKIIKFIANQPLNSFKLKDKLSKSSLPNDTPQLLTELPNIAKQSICKDIDDIKDELLNEEISREDSDDETSSIESNSQKVKMNIDDIFKAKIASCPLCFETMPINECIVLMNCAHSICNSCVKLYIDAFIENSNGDNLSCAVCDDGEIELAVLANFVSDINKFEKYLASRINKILSIMYNYKWCSSPNCNKAIKVDLSSTPFGILSCECGHQTCLKCNQEPHFPAKCSQLAKYYSELKAKNNFLISKEKDIFVGKRCPNCKIFMEKNGGCNSMTCTVCKETFCWKCVKIWSEHIKLTGGTHDCVVSTDKNQLVTYEFKKEKKKLKIKKDAENFHENSIYHREKRSRQNNRERAKNIKRILETIKIGELCENFDNLSFQDQYKAELMNRQETRCFLQKTLSFSNELHFICEHTYLLLTDNSLEKNSRNLFLNILNSIELINWKINNIFEVSTGVGIVNELKELVNKGLNCLKKINSIKI